ncbi:membrane protein [Mycobacterium phage Ph8s]|nr:membrane protein [Mycobacterium phage Ph8s]
MSGPVLVAVYISLAGLLSWFCMLMENREEDERGQTEKDNGGRPAGLG